MPGRPGRRFDRIAQTKEAATRGGLGWLPQLTANHFLLMRLLAFPSETVSVVPAHVSVDHAMAGRGDRYEHHFLAACRTTRENRWDAVRRYAYCRHVRTSLVRSAGAALSQRAGAKKVSARAENSSNSNQATAKFKVGHKGLKQASAVLSKQR
jgi:hypothetical protein